MIKETKNLRVEIDGLARLTKELKPIKMDLPAPKGLSGTDVYYNSREIENAKTSLFLGKAWLGKILQELDVPTPYKKDGNRKTIEDIEPTADIKASESNPTKDGRVYEQRNHIEKVDWLRQEIKAVVDIIQAPDFASSFSTRELSIARTNAYNHLSEARFHLGFELERIKEENE